MRKNQTKYAVVCFIRMIVLLTASVLLAQTSLESSVSTQIVNESNGVDSAESIKEKKLQKFIKNKQLVDGVYIGESMEWTGMKVQVEVNQGEVQAVEVLDVHGSPDYYEVVVKMLPRRMKRKKTFDVDGITGSTLSCESIKSAVKLALYQAIPGDAAN